MGIVQFTNYLRLMQFVMHVSMLNEELELLSSIINKLSSPSENISDRMRFDCLSSSTKLFEDIEVLRHAYGMIWRVHQLLCRCFGLSLLVIIFNAFLSATCILYFSILINSRNITITSITQPLLHTLHIAVLFLITVNSCEASDALVS